MCCVSLPQVFLHEYNATQPIHTTKPPITQIIQPICPCLPPSRHAYPKTPSPSQTPALFQNQEPIRINHPHENKLLLERKPQRRGRIIPTFLLPNHTAYRTLPKHDHNHTITSPRPHHHHHHHHNHHGHSTNTRE